jgi:hypothetical protein
MARNEKVYGQISLKLPCMPTPQNKKPEDTWMAQTSGSTATTMERPEHRLWVGLPESDGYNAIWVVVDRFSKMKRLVPC